MPPHVANFLLGSFGIVAAVLLVGGSVVLRAQQNRQRFELAKLALQSGQPLPTPGPLWVGLKRQAESIVAVGVGLIVVGLFGWWLGSGATVPTLVESNADAPTTAPAVQRQAFFGPPQPPAPPPRPSPQVEAWHSAQERLAVGQTAVGCGVILTLLGVVRLRSADRERTLAATGRTADAIETV